MDKELQEKDIQEINRIIDYLFDIELTKEEIMEMLKDTLAPKLCEKFNKLHIFKKCEYHKEEDLFTVMENDKRDNNETYTSAMVYSWTNVKADIFCNED